LPSLAAAGTTGSPGPNQLYGHISSNRTLTAASPGPNYEIIGDLTIDPGVTLTIQRGVSVDATPFSDYLASGVDRGRVELIVAGALLVPAGPGSVSITCPAVRGWQGISVASGGSALLNDCLVENAALGMVVGDGGTVVASRCTFNEVVSGVQMGPLSSVSLPGCVINGTGQSYGIYTARSFGSADSLAPQPVELVNFAIGVDVVSPGVTITRVLTVSCAHGIQVDQHDVTLNYCTTIGGDVGVTFTNTPTTQIYNCVLESPHPIDPGPVPFQCPNCGFCNYTDAYSGNGLGDPFGGVPLGNQNSSFDPFFTNNGDLDPASLFTNYSVSGGEIGAYGPGPVLPTPVLGASVVDSEGSGGVVRVRWFADTRGSSKAGIYRRTEAGEWQPLTVLYPDGQGYLKLEDRDVQAGTLYGYGVGVQRDSHVGIEGVVWVRVEAPVSRLSIQNVGPNPATTAWSIGFDSPTTSEATIEAIDLTGRVVRTERLGALTSGRQSFSLPAQGLPPGIYWIRVREGGSSSLAKALKTN
jgi:hypothetical protein